MRLVFVHLIVISAALAGASSWCAAQVQPAAAPRARDVSLIDPNRPVSMPPTTPQGKDDSELHDTRVSDPYRWLENPNDPTVQKWIAAQNAHTEAVLAAMPDGKAMTARV